MNCPYLTYRTSGGEVTFDTDRAYCTVVDEFVQPLRADMCNERGELSYEEHCEYYRRAEGLDPDAGTST